MTSASSAKAAGLCAIDLSRSSAESTPVKYSPSVCRLPNHRRKPLAVSRAVALPNPRIRGARRNFPYLGPLLEPEVSVALEQRLCFAEFLKKAQRSHRSTIFVGVSPEENDGFAIEDTGHSQASPLTMTLGAPS
ncbi:hypothetical protein BHE74_00035237 [Ensete ventricosum]|nr:hypothetical protein BHE74_00035237 [Ensete ventricosum]